MSVEMREQFEHAVKVAKGEVVDWRATLMQMDVRIERLNEQMMARPTIPPELQDAYREEIDGLTLENMQLTSRLDQTKEALSRAKAAYRDEVRHSKTLLERLDQLEKRIAMLLGR